MAKFAKKQAPRRKSKSVQTKSVPEKPEKPEKPKRMVLDYMRSWYGRS